MVNIFLRYSYGWIYKELESGYAIKVEIKQTQTNTGLFWMPVDLNIATQNGSVVRVAWDSLQTQSFQFLLEDKPLTVTLDADDWILKETTSHLLTPNIENVALNNPYQEPGSGILHIQSESNNPDSLNISLSAVIEALIKAGGIQLFHTLSGNHQDVLASDGIFGGSWPLPVGELYYQLHMLTHDLDSGFINYQQNVSGFTSVGPVSMVDFITATGDTITEPGSDFLIKLRLQNFSNISAIPNISAKPHNQH